LARPFRWFPDEPYSDKGDAWFPYLEEEDGRVWLRFIIDQLEQAMVRMEVIAREAWPDRIYAPDAAPFAEERP